METNGKLYTIMTEQSSKISEIEQSLETIADNTRELRSIKEELTLMRATLIKAATQHVPLESVEMLSKLHMNVIKILAVIISLIITWFTGIKYFMPALLP